MGCAQALRHRSCMWRIQTLCNLLVKPQKVTVCVVLLADVYADIISGTASIDMKFTLLM